MCRTCGIDLRSSFVGRSNHHQHSHEVADKNDGVRKNKSKLGGIHKEKQLEVHVLIEEMTTTIIIENLGVVKMIIILKIKDGLGYRMMAHEDVSTSTSIEMIMIENDAIIKIEQEATVAVVVVVAVERKNEKIRRNENIPERKTGIRNIRVDGIIILTMIYRAVIMMIGGRKRRSIKGINDHVMKMTAAKGTTNSMMTAT